MLILVILKTLRFVELLGLIISRPTPTILRKPRFGKIHSIGNLLVWPAPDSLIPYFLGIFADLAFQPDLLWWEIFEGDGADRAWVIGLIRQGFARVGFESDLPDRDQVNSDQGLVIGRSGCDRSDPGQLRSILVDDFGPNRRYLSLTSRYSLPISHLWSQLVATTRH